MIRCHVQFQLQRISSLSSETWQTTLHVRFTISHGSQRDFFVDHFHLHVSYFHYNDHVSLSNHLQFPASNIIFIFVFNFHSQFGLQFSHVDCYCFHC